MSDRKITPEGYSLRKSKSLIVTVMALLMLATAGCSAIVAVGDAAITVGATVVKVTAKAAGAVVNAVIPDSDKKKEDQ